MTCVVGVYVYVVRGGRGKRMSGRRRIKAYMVLDSNRVKKFVKAGNDFDH